MPQSVRSGPELPDSDSNYFFSPSADADARGYKDSSGESTSVCATLSRILKQVCADSPAEELEHPAPGRAPKCRRDSTTEEVQFQPVQRKWATKIYRRARKWDRETCKRDGTHGGIVGPAALAVLEALVFDFLSFATGKLLPCYRAIAKKAALTDSAVAEAIKRLRHLRIIDWLRRAVEVRQPAGGILRRQASNAYFLQPETGWLGYTPPAEPPPPHSDTWGSTRQPPALDQAALALRKGAELQTVAAILEEDPKNELEATLARIARDMHLKLARNTVLQKP